MPYSDQKKGMLLAFTAIMFITPDSLFIRLANLTSWNLIFYRGFIPFVIVFLGLLIIYYFDLSGFAAGVLLIQCSMPSAVLNYLVGSMYSPKKIVDDIASMIVVSTLMSLITVPIQFAP